MGERFLVRHAANSKKQATSKPNANRAMFLCIDCGSPLRPGAQCRSQDDLNHAYPPSHAMYSCFRRSHPERPGSLLCDPLACLGCLPQIRPGPGTVAHQSGWPDQGMPAASKYVDPLRIFNVIHSSCPPTTTNIVGVKHHDMSLDCFTYLGNMRPEALLCYLCTLLLCQHADLYLILSLP